MNYYKDINPDFNDAVENYKNAKNKNIQKVKYYYYFETTQRLYKKSTKFKFQDDLINGLCVLYLYGNLTITYLFKYFVMNYTSLTIRLHECKIRLFGRTQEM